MSDVAIRVEGLSKQYRIGGPQAGYKTFREGLTDMAVAPLRRPTPPEETIWALKDVSFEVQRGEVVSIFWLCFPCYAPLAALGTGIGRNGAGSIGLHPVRR